MSTTREKWQEIANRGLQDKFDPETRAKFDEAVNRGLITLPDQQGFGSAALETAGIIGRGAAGEIGGGLMGLFELARTQDPRRAAQAVEQVRQDFAATDISPRTKAQLEDIGQAVELASTPVAGLAGLTELARGEDLSRAAQTVESVKERGLGRTAGERVFDETGNPMLATLAETSPTALLEATGLGLLGKVGRGVERAGGLPAVAQGAVRPVVETVQTVTESAKPVAGQLIESGQKTAKEIFEYQSPAKRKIGQLIEEGKGDVDTARFQLTEAGKVVTDKLADETIKQGFDKSIIAMAKTSSKADKKLMSKMTDFMEKSKRNARFDSRPSDIVGDVLLSKIKAIRNANRSAGLKINEIAKELKGKPIDVGDAVGDFAASLDSLGVRLIRDDKGNFKPDFDISQLSPGDRAPIKEVIRQMNIRGAGGVDALAAHKMKRLIDNNVTFGKTKTGMSGDAERALKSFRNKLDSALDETYPDYNKANTVYADTIGALDSLQSSLGTKLDLSGPHADKALGTKLRGLLSNNATRVNLLDATKEVEAIAKKHGAGSKLLIEGKGLGGSSIRDLILFADELDNRFGPVARTSFQGQIKQAVTDASATAAQAKVDPVGAAVRGVAGLAERARGINDENAFKAMRDLLRQSR